MSCWSLYASASLSLEEWDDGVLCYRPRKYHTGNEDTSTPEEAYVFGIGDFILPDSGEKVSRSWYLSSTTSRFVEKAGLAETRGGGR
jgi:hypothetical protein